MSRRTILAALLASVAAAALAFAAFVGRFWYQDVLRVRDARPAFEPIEQALSPQIWSNPTGSRHCRYVVEFPPESRLTDHNVAVLASLNRLPAENTLDVVIRTPAVTDAAIPILASITTFDQLEVTHSGLTNDGIAQLRKLLPRTEINPRRLEAKIAQQALVELIRSQPKLFVGSPDADRIATLKPELRDDGKYALGAFVIDVRDYAYSAEIGHDAPELYFYEGRFEFENGKWFATRPTVTRLHRTHSRGSP